MYSSKKNSSENSRRMNFFTKRKKSENTQDKENRRSPFNKIKLPFKQMDPQKKEAVVQFLNKYSPVLHIFLACFLCFIIEWISRHSFTDAISFVFDRKLAFLYNSLIVYISLLLTYLFKRRTLIRILISTLWLFLGIINGCILAKRVTPFSYTDLKLVNDLFTMQSNYFTFKEELLVIVGVLLVVLCIAYIWRKGPKFMGRPRRLICLFSISGFLLLIPMVTQAAVNNNILAGYFENLAQGYKDYGFVYSFSASVIDRGMSAPADYTEEKVKEVQNNIEKEETTLTDDDKPNIICVLLESFVDPSEIKFLNTSEEAVPNFKALKENYSTGHLTVPVVGAGTANTEFEILTGMGMQFFGLGEYPYKTILKQTAVESVASDLNALDYGTHVVHNNGGNFYSRKNAFTQMGFDTFTSKEMINIQEYTPIGTWPTDHVLIDEVSKSLDSTPDKSDFVYTITVEGHGSYPTERVVDDPAITVTGASSEEMNNSWEYYVNQIHKVDKFIKDLTDMLAQRDEKTVVVFFGDHLPTMDLTAEDMVTNDLFQTEYVTWNNFGMEKKDMDLASYQLLASITDQAGIHEGTMLSLHQANDFQNYETYSDAMELLQYDILYGNRYAYNGEDLYPASNLVMGVNDIVISKLAPAGDKFTITGSNFTPWSRVFINDEKVSTTFISDTEIQFPTDKLQDGKNTIVVNQMGSSNTIFRSSNSMTYMKINTENVSE